MSSLVTAQTKAQSDDIFLQKHSMIPSCEFAYCREEITINTETLLMTQLSGDMIRHKLPTYVFGQNVVYTKQTGSTNTELKQFARQGAPEGFLYVTEEQLAGRGRLDRKWYTPAGSSLLMSLLFRPGEVVNPAHSQWLTMLCALALADAIKTHTDLAPGLKWPNDLVWEDGKKLAGILTEMEIEEERLNWVVVGTGLNVNVDFMQEEKRSHRQPGNGGTPLSQKATSLSTILGKASNHLRLPILQKYLFNVERRYEALHQGWIPHREWGRRLAGMGQQVTIIETEGQKYQGTMIGVEENGALILEQANGKIKTFLAGDVSLRL
jgi:BirA family biotin operon repressor/biotin-[acetyl-CoA-carboxylase] ligase